MRVISKTICNFVVGNRNADLNMTQEQQVIETMREQGGYATLRQLNEVMDFSSWKTKTPEASVRRIVQNSDAIFESNPFYGLLRKNGRRFSRNSISRRATLKASRHSATHIIKDY